jgi:hypothetical protein
MISVTAALSGIFLPKSLILLILTKSEFQPILYPVRKMALLMGFSSRWTRADSENLVKVAHQ